MAKKQEVVTYTNCTIDIGDMTITEFCDDKIRTFPLSEILGEWHGKTGIEITLKQVAEVRENG